MLYAIINQDASIADLINGDIYSKPPGSVTLTDAQIATINNSKYGHAQFLYVSGELIVNQPFLDERALSALRNQRTIETRAEAARRFVEIDGSLTPDNAAFFSWLSTSTNLVLTGPDSKKVRNIAKYLDGRIIFIRGATLAQLQAYNPSSDPNWP